MRHPPACGVQRARATMHTLCKGRKVNSVSVAISWPVMALGMLATYHAKCSLRGGAQGPRAAPRQHPAGVLQASAAHMFCHACIDSSTALAQCIAPMAQVAGGQCSCRWHVSCVRLRHLTTGRLEGFQDAPPWFLRRPLVFATRCVWRRQPRCSLAGDHSADSADSC